MSSVIRVWLISALIFSGIDLGTLLAGILVLELRGRLVGDAPLLGGWRIRALKPPLLEDFSVHYGDQEITTREIWLKIESMRDVEQPLRWVVAIRRESDSDQPGEAPIKIHY